MPVLAKLNRPVVAILAVGLIAGVLRFTNLDYPQRRMFDEYYYPKSACIFLGYSNERCDINRNERLWREQVNDTGAWVHPPLGKWAIALGELAAGTDSYGWRVSSAVAGTATVMLLAVIVQLLFASPIWTFTGGVLLATESLHFVQSRVAMLDIFVTFWIVLGFVFLLLDRRWIQRRMPEPPPATWGGDGPGGTDRIRHDRVPAPLWRPWRFAAGAALGAGIATKWSALTALVAVIVLSPGSGAAQAPGTILRNAIVRGLRVVLALLVGVVYVASYAGLVRPFRLDVRAGPSSRARSPAGTPTCRRSAPTDSRSTGTFRTPGRGSCCVDPSTTTGTTRRVASAR
jgi:hypothetical protein